MKPGEAHQLDLYRLSVQRPVTQVNLLTNLYAFYRAGRWATRLREDFSGTAAVAVEWVRQDRRQRALAVERDGPTCQWSRRRAAAVLGEEALRLRVVRGDVMAVDGRGAIRGAGGRTSGGADLTAALNFSVFIFHRREELVGYFRHARRSLARDGVLVVDVYGGPGAMRAGVWKRRVKVGAGEDGFFAGSIEQSWEQRSYDAATGRVDCRIHFRVGAGATMRDAFVYDWRLWTVAELREAMTEAGFARAAVWCDGYDPRKKMSDGEYREVESVEGREDFVAYVVGVK